MQQTLADFRIESDRVVYLAFADGRSYRVSPGELDRFLARDDLRRVRRALRLRQQFIRRVLPPTVLVVLLVGIGGLGRYDVYRVAHSWLSAPATSSQTPVRTVTPAASTQPTSSVSTSAATTKPTAGSTTRAAAPAQNTVLTQQTTVPAASSSQRPASGAAAQPLLPLAPVTTPTKTATPLLAPITTPLAHAVGQLSKLLP